MAADYENTNAFRGATFKEEDLTDSKFRDCDLRRMKVVDSYLTDVSMSGLIGNFIVNDVDVTAFVEGELDRRYPERVQVRNMKTADDYRAMWDRIERLWAETVARAQKLPEPALQERVDDEWSFVETLRHLLFATDAWVGSAVLDQDQPYHPLGITHSSYPPADAAKLGVDFDARPSLDEVLEARAGRLALVRGIVDGFTEAEMERVFTRKPAPLYPEESRRVGRCIGVIMREEIEHRRYAERDLAVLEAR